MVSIVHGLSCAHLKAYNVVASLVILKLAFSVAKFGIDFLQTAVDEGLGVCGNLVLVSVSLTVVADSQVSQIVDGPVGYSVADRDVDDGRGLARLCHSERSGILIRCHLW